MAASLELLPWSTKEHRFFLSREEEYVGALRAATQIWLRMADGGLSVEDALLMRQMVDWPGGLELHIGVCDAPCSLDFLVQSAVMTLLISSYFTNLCPKIVLEANVGVLYGALVSVQR
jgi:hypothetical protein